MPKVPTYDNFTVAPSSQSGAQIAAPDTSQIGGIPARQAQELGQGLMTAGDVAGRIAASAADKANQVRFDDTANAGKEEAMRLEHDKDVGFSNLRGTNALQRPNGQSLADEYGGKLQSHLSKLAKGLGNDVQRVAFAKFSNELLSGFTARLTKHEADEFRTYSLSTSEGIQSTAKREIELNYNNPESTEAAVNRIRGEVYRQGQLLGKSAEWQEAQARKMTSGAHKVALMSALEKNDVTYADSYLKRYADQMDGDDILSVRGHITKEMDTRVGMGAALETLQRFQPRIKVSETERAFNIALGAESGNRQFGPDGTPLTSPKGAVGIAQVMPDTAPEAAKLAGLPWDEAKYKNDPNYNRALGLAYFQKQLQENGGDLARAYAAYNAGPQRVKDALKKADQSAKLAAAGDPGVKALTWLEFMPAETRAYVAKNLQAYDAGQGQAPRATFEEIDAQLRADPRLAGSPHRLQVAHQEATRLYENQTKAIKQRDEESVAEAMRGIIQNGGRYSELPITLRAAIPPKEVDNVIGFAQKIAKGDDTTSLWLYNKLAQDPTRNPWNGEKLSDAAFFALQRELSLEDFKHFSNERAKRNGTAGGGTGGPGDLDSTGIKQALDDRLRMLQIDPTPKDDGGAEAARLGGVRKFVNDYFRAAQMEAGKKFNDADIARHLDGLFAKNATLRGWFTESSGPMLGMKANDIPTDDRMGIRRAFERQGITDPTDAQVLHAYWNMRTARKK
jgi:soluble lytic murein transglycosylase